MELWIRTQNKNELLKVEDLCVEYNGALDPELHPYRIIAKVDDKEIKLGIYKDEERAMEILDEIQKYMNNGCEFLEREQHTSMGTYKNKEQMRVYEMPKE